ncbi:C-phycoerythrin beta chain [Frankliniella fusca]|uniref:C-phycoerythrin beta chain n=1 Tax=Frankliniella fusca TaxID=407009 RepID=A0AAE1HHU4_9NEOP|nr:C-phycoerythrin beta chain [Frankliniella fusca]
MPPELADKIVVIDEDTYHVPSAITGEATYEVVASAGSCMCKAGAAGAFCKHQALVHHKFKCMFPNQPLISSADRYIMGLLAMGNKCPEKEFFLDPKETLENLERNLQLINEQEEIHLENVSGSNQMQSDDVLITNESPPSTQQQESDDENNGNDGEEDFKTFIRAWEKIFRLGTETNSKGFRKFVKRTSQSLDKVTSSNKAFEGMMKTAAVWKTNVARYNKKIPVGPHSIARRREGLTKGSSRVPAGRPSEALRAKLNSKGHKRQRKLGASVAANKPHYRKH